jgi:glycine/D-amino acid oxidase-like deaminating enzyme
MRIAILGAGFSGLSAAWHLLNTVSCQVVLFDSKGIGGGASGIAAGLLHPYVGEAGKRSLLAGEGIESAKELITSAEEKLGQRVANRDGIFRHVVNEKQNQMFLSHCKQFKDVKPHGEGCFWIDLGMTLDCPRYLAGLWQVVLAKGATLVSQEICNLRDLQGFDHVVVAAGAGIARFPELSSLRLGIMKGQVLICRAPELISLPLKSSICKGYLALSLERRICCIGSTYERGEMNEIPDLAMTRSTLFPKIHCFFPEVEKLEVVACRAALRVVGPGHYFPIAAKVSEGLWVLTAMGSRGLLYHAFLGKLLAEAIATGNDLPLSFLSINEPKI